MVSSYISMYRNIVSTKISGDECEMMQVFKMIISIYLVGFCNSQEQFRGDI